MKTFLRYFYLTEASIAALCYATVGVAMIADVIAREFFNYSIYGLQRASVLLVIVTAYLGMGLATADNKHLRPRFTDGWIPVAYHPAMARIGDLLAAIIFAAMGWFAFKLLQTGIKWDDKVNILLIPLWSVQWVMPYGFLSSAFRFLIFFFRPDLKPGEQEAEQ